MISRGGIGGVVGERLKREGDTHSHTGTHTRLIYNIVQQKLTQHCKVMMFL